MSDHYYDKFKAEKGDATALSSSFKPVINVVCPSGAGTQQCNDRTCLPTELVKNGGFEQKGVLTAFANWNESTEFFQIQSSEL